MTKKDDYRDDKRDRERRKYYGPETKFNQEHIVGNKGELRMEEDSRERENEMKNEIACLRKTNGFQ